MPTINWSIFEGLPGAATTNFEYLCRSIVRRHYGRFGQFRALANQPGVEFHLRLEESCPLGAAGRWFGWQCRWYELPSGTNIGSARRAKIEDAIRKTESVLPGVTDWVLWTRHTLTAADQQWYFAISTKMKLALWSSIEVEEHLVGPAAILRETYFGELVLTAGSLDALRAKSVEPIRARWLPAVHQVVEAEREIRGSLGEVGYWSALSELADQIGTDIAGLTAVSSGLAEQEKAQVQLFADHAGAVRDLLSQSFATLVSADFDLLRQLCKEGLLPTNNEQQLVRYLRTGRHAAGLWGANVLADMHQAWHLMHVLSKAIDRKLLFVTAGAGCGKTQLTAELTAAATNKPAGVFLRGKALAARGTLDNLARQVFVHGKALTSFEALVAAVDAAGQRQNTRLSIAIDGLNESEDPRDWKDEMASLAVMLKSFEHVQVVCTLRPAFVEQAVPDGADLLEINGFEENLGDAIGRYFEFYKINATDAELPWELLNHPLSLRIFCEVTNANRKQVVGVSAIPSSLAVLFERYLDQASAQIASLSPASCRFFPADVTAALQKIGERLWGGYSREIGIKELRQLLGDEGRPWDQSLVAALESEGLLFREPGERPDDGRMSLIYDALAGHVIADAVFGKHVGDAFNKWIRAPKTLTALQTSSQTISLLDRTSARLTNALPKVFSPAIQFARNKLRRSPRYTHHPLAYDVFRSLVGLMPRRVNGKQLWPLLKGSMGKNALVEAAFLDGAHLDQETVAQLMLLTRERLPLERDLLRRLFATRAAQAHPLNANFLDAVLRPMAIPDRDLRWSEWLRNQSPVGRDIERISGRWKQGRFLDGDDSLRARWIMWTLTSTVRKYRDQATYALYLYGSRFPSQLFALALDSLPINDPYVQERMLAACYGIAMTHWADPNSTALRSELPGFAAKLVDEMLVENAPYGTTHILIRSYVIGIVELAQKLNPNCILNAKSRFLKLEYPDLPSPFPNPATIPDEILDRAKLAMRMDFENYTLGRLVSERRNYDYKNSDYVAVRRQIAWRVCDLGYSERFIPYDKMVAEAGWRTSRHEKPKVDRYGKKYSWIAYFEMYGVRLAHGLLEGDYGGRPSDIDIDPSFPNDPKSFTLKTADIFGAAPTNPTKWLAEGPSPSYAFLLQTEVVDGIVGPWLLVQGFIEENAPNDDRQVFTFLRGVLVNPEDTDRFISEFGTIEYPGNSAIPEPGTDYYTYAGEVPWSRYFGYDLREPDGKARRDVRAALSVHDGTRWLEGVPVEIPVRHFGWESYHSELNQAGGVNFLAPALCESLNLTSRGGEWDLYDSTGRQATIYRRFKVEGETHKSNLLFVRADLMAEYLSGSHELLWVVWGERNFHYRNFERYRSSFSGHTHIHRNVTRWSRTSPSQQEDS